MPTRRDALLKLPLVFPLWHSQLSLWGQSRKPIPAGESPKPIPGAQKAASLDTIRFRNVTASAGLNFTVENSPTPEKHLIETMTGGVAAFDYNGDGLTDIFFANGAALPSLEKSSPKYWNRLFRNEGGMRFKDVTEEAGVAGAGYSMGAAAGDYDNDGHVDLFVAGVN